MNWRTFAAAVAWLWVIVGDILQDKETEQELGVPWLLSLNCDDYNSCSCGSPFVVVHGQHLQQENEIHK